MVACLVANWTVGIVTLLGVPLVVVPRVVLAAVVLVVEPKKFSVVCVVVWLDRVADADEFDDVPQRSVEPVAGGGSSVLVKVSPRLPT